jgi:signal transduction histidine kinase/CheY-like chemotaxis protein
MSSQQRARSCLISLLWMMALAMMPAWSMASAQPLATPLHKGANSNLLAGAQLYQDHGQQFPATVADLPRWRAALRPAAKVDLLGGSYWLVVAVRNDSTDPNWVLDANDTLIDVVDARLYGVDGSEQRVTTGYRASHDYLLHYGKAVTLTPGADYHLALRFSSPYYARTPVIALSAESDYRALVWRENVLIIGSLGALLALAIFNFFIVSFTRDRSTLFYALYIVAYGAAWAMTFHLPTDLFGFRMLELHYLPFFLLPVFSTLFYTRFLRLATIAPRLARASRINLVLPLVLMPSCFLALNWAHTLATVAISIWMVLALASGVTAWRKGYRPARYFVFGFVALMLPGLFILPANLGLTPALVGNAQLWTLLGGTLDGLLLAFALADRIRLMGSTLEQQVQERTADLTRSNLALTQAKNQAEAVSRHRIDFLSAMSHDIRTPLAGVIGMLKFALQDASVQGRTQEYLRVGLHNGESLLAILNDILDFSKIDAGKLSLEQVDFRLADLTDDAIAILQGNADSKSLLLRAELDAGLPEFVRADPTRIRQILLNLLGNAIKFTERGEVVLRVSADAAQLTFSVTDTGLGIAPEVHERLFQRFEQADHSTTRRYGGTGLGLAICKELVTLMGGAIFADSRVGIGSRFWFTLPLLAGSAPPHAAQKVRGRHSHQLRVLCAEDVRTNQIIIGTLLEYMGHQVHIVENGVEALHALSTSDFDLVLMDGRMPLMDGEQATRLIRAGGSATEKVRDSAVAILALTANASEPDCSRYLAAGMNGFLSKPVDDKALYDHIEELIVRLLERGRPLRRQADVDTHDARDVEHELALQFGGSHASRITASPAAAPITVVPLPGLSRQHMENITQAFLEEAPRKLAQGREALDTGDARAASLAFHALKGSAGYLSSSELHQLAHRMENLVTEGDLMEAEALYPEVEKALRRALRDLQPVVQQGVH